MKNTLMLVLSLLLGLLMLAYVVSSAGINEIAQAFELLSFYKYLLVFGFYFLIYLIILARWGIILSNIGHHIPFSKLLSFRLSEWAFGYITPFSRLGGEPVMAYLFKRESGISYRQGIAAIILNKMMDFSAALMLTLVGVILFLLNYSSYLSKNASFAVLFVVLLLSALVYLFFIKIAKQEGFFSRITAYFKKIFHSSIHNSIIMVEKEMQEYFRKNRKKAITAASVTIITNLLMLVVYKVLALFLGVNLSFIQVLMVFALITIAYLVPTPGSLGSLEGALALSFYALGYGAGAGVAFALVIRSFELVLTGMGLLFISYYGVKLKGLN